MFDYAVGHACLPTENRDFRRATAPPPMAAGVVFAELRMPA
jgi:hypothetical protein